MTRSQGSADGKRSGNGRPRSVKKTKPRVTKLHPMLDRSTRVGDDWEFEKTLDPQVFYLADHVIQGRELLPGVAYLEMARAAATHAGLAPTALRDIAWMSPLVAEGAQVEASLNLKRTAKDTRFQVASTGKTHAEGRLAYEAQDRPAKIDLEALKQRLPARDAAECYVHLAEMGFGYGPSFRSITAWHGTESEALARLELPAALADEAEHFSFHPVLADGALQTAICTFPNHGEPALPFAMDAIVFHAPTTSPAYVHAKARDFDPHALFHVFDIELCDDQGLPLASFQGCTFKAAAATSQMAQPEPAALASAPAAPLEGVDATLRGLTLDFLKDIVAEALHIDAGDINTRNPFAWYGVDSFNTLLIIKLLEDEVGSLRKTLLFENANLEALTDCFMREQRPYLMDRFKLTAPAPAPAVQAARAAASPEPLQPTAALPLVLRADQAFADPALAVVLEPLRGTYRHVLSTTYAARGIAPFLFLGAERQGYFLFNHSKRTLLVWAYVGPAEYQATLTAQMLAYGAARKLAFNYVTHQPVIDACGTALAATPFGAFQHLGALAEFSLAGNAMRRLRYMVSKFEKEGDCRTAEFKVGSDSAQAEAIAAVIDAWIKKKGHVNPFIHQLRKDILAGQLDPDYRVFTTHVGDQLMNVILVARMYDDQWLMDLEFYGPDMPLGGLEFTVCNIVALLLAEGARSYSLGATWGPSLGDGPHQDPALVAFLEDMRGRDDFGKGNFQFKNKFRTHNESVYLNRPSELPADSAVDVLMMIANPPNQKPGDQPLEVPAELVFPRYEVEAAPTAPLPVAASTPAAFPAATAPTHYEASWVGDDRDQRDQLLARFGQNPIAIPAGEIRFDLMTDSWAELDTPYITGRVRALEDRRGATPDLNEALRAVFPFPYLITVASGRLAESYFAAAFPKTRKRVLQNPLFPTWIFHQLDKGFRPEELVQPAALEPQQDAPFKGDLPLERLDEILAADGDQVAAVVVELANNATGGHAVSRANLEAVSARLRSRGIPLILDATRFAENALAVCRAEGRGDDELLTVNAELLALADAVTASLTKDFGVNVGGLIALRDQAQYHQLRDAVTSGGSGLNTRDMQLIARAASDLAGMQGYALARVAQAEQLWQTLDRAGLPVARPAGGHCVLLDVTALPALAGYAWPAQSLLAHLFRETGVRASVHSAGMKRDTKLSRMIRLAVPVGLADADIAELGGRLANLLGDAKRTIPALEQVSKEPGLFGEAKAVYRQLPVAAPAPKAVPAPTPQAAPAAVAPARPAAQPPLTHQPSPRHSEGAPHMSRSRDIAIIGIAGRYPHARDLHQFWQNLAEGRDSIEAIPDERGDYKKIAAKGKPEIKWGSFLEHVDKFDSLFFSIAPNEAINMDPQERLFLEVAWETIEDAGYLPENLVPPGQKRDIGVFVGLVWTFYQTIGSEEVLKGNVNGANSWLWAVPNRVSYFMDFTGPSLAIDTACSSSLTALHMARESILRGECSAAIAGGVNLDLHPTKRLILDNGGFLSPKGRCHAFGNQADGYVPGEGVGAVLLKPLERAIADHDFIHAVIKGSAVNHGGLTTGFTVPSPNAQGDLIRAALKEAGVDAGSISYLEAHGTGTKLGDPIEIQALTQAFAADTKERGFCAIGSVKSNIGHLEAAAGIAGLTKVVLQMRHRTLAPSLHAATLNEFIDFATTPFQVQRELAPWQRPVRNGVELPRRAGLSSFGAGGSNAHVVLEEYETPRGTERKGEFLLAISARNEKQLRQYAQRYTDAIAAGHLDGFTLADIVFTAQTARRNLKHRLAVVGNNLGQWLDGLKAFCAEQTPAGVYTGNTGNAKAFTSLMSGMDQKKVIATLLEGNDPHKVAKLWVDGLVKDLADLPTPVGARVPLPTYPFALEKHWIGTAQEISGKGIKPLHTLVHVNESIFGQQKYRVNFQTDHWIFTDHVVGGLPTLPGVGYLEMFRAAGELATGLKVTTLRNMVWAKPITSHQHNQPMYLELNPAGEELGIEIVRYVEDDEREVFARAKLGFGDPLAHPATAALDIQAIKSRQTGTKPAGDVYARMREGGTVHRPIYQTITEFYYSETEALARLIFRDDLLPDFSDLQLHPSLMDGCAQATVVRWDEDGVAYVPFVMNDLHIFRPLTKTGWSYIRYSGEAGRGRKFCITVTDDQGVPCGYATDLTMMPFLVEEQHLMYFHPEWAKLDRLQAETPATGLVLVFDRDERLSGALAAHRPTVLVRPGGSFNRLSAGVFELDPLRPEHYGMLLDQLGERPTGIIHAWSQPASSNDSCLENGVYSLFHLVRALREREKSLPSKLLFVHALGDSEVPENAAVGAFAKTINAECSKLEVVVIGLPGNSPGEAAGAHISELLAEFNAPKSEAETELQLVEGRRLVRQWRTFTPKHEKDLQFVREGGTYLITGGAGGLGLLFAEYLANSAAVNIVLTGRSELSAAKRQRIEAIQGQSTIVYLQADIIQRKSVTALIETIGQRFGALNGILHAAGMLRDSYFWEKTHEDFAAVVAPKQRGTRVLDEATAEQPLDFFVLFSSVSGIKGNLGQSDYAYANAFMDSFAARREEAREKGLRHGHTVSINWPLWEEGGMEVDDRVRQYLLRTWGMEPMETHLGLSALPHILTVDYASFLVIQGDHDKLARVFGPVRRKKAKVEAPKHAAAAAPAPASEPAAGAAAAPADMGSLEERLRTDLWAIIVEILGVSDDDADFDADMSVFGFDSLTFTEFTDTANRKFGLDITPVVFFEYPTLGGLAGHVCRENSARLAKYYGVAAGAGAPAGAAATPASAPAASFASAGFAAPAASFAPAPAAAPAQAGAAPARGLANEPIAVIGMAGAMPQAADLEQFWENMVAERDCITEVPASRWDWRELYGDNEERNKSTAKWGGWMLEIDKFDARFFGISPREAEITDPQALIYLETVYAAIEDAGYKPSDLSGTNTGNYVGVGNYDYKDLYQMYDVELQPYTLTGSFHTILINRVSYMLNITGPSIPIDTACSSALVAVHMAVEAIWLGHCPMAIAGGVNTNSSYRDHFSIAKSSMLAADGRCKTFDSRADGYTRSEGTGAILLKPLSAAERDGDRIYGTIIGSDTNHGGHTNTLTTPSPNLQAELLINTWRRTGVEPETITYFEAHGTGTSLGDPIEVSGMIKAMTQLYADRGKQLPKDKHVWIGSVKSNVGHLERAAGIAGVLKVLLAFQHKTLPASINIIEVNPYIKLDDTPLQIVRHTQPWEVPVDANGAERFPRRAGVSSFGMGGVYGHIAMQSYAPKTAPAAPQVEGPHLFVLSAKAEDRLREYAGRLAQFLAKNGVGLGGGGYKFPGRETLTSELTVLAGQVLGINPSELDPAGDMVEAGFDALTMTRYAKSIADKYGYEPPAELFSQHHTIDLLAGQLANREERVQASSSLDPYQVAYTLQVGRDIHDYRLAMATADLAELERELAVFADGGTPTKLLYGAKKKGQQPSLDKAGIAAAFKERNWQALAEAFTTGAKVEFDGQYNATNRPQRMSLPTYPFARDRHWVEIKKLVVVPADQAGSSTASSTAVAAPAQLHPLLGRNASTLAEQRFVTRFSGEEPFLRDHVVGKARLLPGVAYLEMARAAGELAAEAPVRAIVDTVWELPVAVAETAVEVKIALFPEDAAVSYTVASESGDEHARGRLIFGAPEPAGPRRDIEGLRVRCPRDTSGETFYELLAKNGFHYGPTHRAITRLSRGQNEVLAELALPAEAAALDVYGLHPSLMDAALQTVVSLIAQSGDGSAPSCLPYALAAVHPHAPLTAQCFAHAVQLRAQGDVVHYQLEILDPQGHPLVTLEDFAVRILDGQSAGDITYLFRPEWIATALPQPQTREGALLLFDVGSYNRDLLARQPHQRGPILQVRPGSEFAVERDGYRIRPAEAGDYERLLEALAQAGHRLETVLMMWSSPVDLQDASARNGGLDRGLYAVFHMARALVARKLATQVSLIHAYSGTPEESPLDAAVSGLLRSLHWEHPGLAWKSVVMGMGVEADALLAELSQPAEGYMIRLETTARHVRRLKPYAAPHGAHPAKEGGVYLITGGAGALGRIFAQYLAQKPGVALMLSGRSAASVATNEVLDRLRALGAKAAYQPADLTRAEDVAALVQATRAQFGRIDGVIHASGILRDGYLIRKNREVFESVLAPKLLGSLNLDRETAADNLDFFALVSSVASAMGNMGQSDYAAANAFMDAFAALRQNMVRQGLRRGRSLALGYALWEEGGMKVDAEARAWLRGNTGIVPMRTAEGLRAFADGLASGETQLFPAAGDRARLERVLAMPAERAQAVAAPAAATPVPTAQPSASGAVDYRKKLVDYLREQIAAETKLAVSSLDPDEALESYGIDSQLIMALNRRLEKDFGRLSRTIFFEHQSIDALVGYFLENHLSIVQTLFGGAPAPAAPAAVAVSPAVVAQSAPAPTTAVVVRSRFAGAASPQPSVAQPVAKAKAEIAIIGLSGRFPQAPTLVDFWENLLQGRDCIEPIPESRWDHSRFFVEGGAPGKSNCNFGGFIEDVDSFDPKFFNISPREALTMDPQERLFLETAEHTFEDAGYPRKQVAGKPVGVFVGIMWGHYQLFGAEEILKGNNVTPESSYASIANRVSYFYNLSGPSMAIDTMCSSSLAAIHLGCQSIWNEDSEMALAGGVNITVHPYKYLRLGMGNFTAADGRCRSFGEGGTGYVPGEGTGAVLLKSLERAKADGDYIYATVRASALNHGGKTNGYTVPNPIAQGELIAKAVERAQLEPGSLGYIEAHGTGTALGDPIEITGLNRAFKPWGMAPASVPIGSVKSNVGHLESAAGIAAVAKVLLMMKHARLVPSIHGEPANSNINFAGSPFFVQKVAAPWPQGRGRDGRDLPRVAGISSFGAGGSNAHLILADYEGNRKSQHDGEPLLFVFSARTQASLLAYTASFARFLRANWGFADALVDMAYSLQVGREHMAERLAIVVQSKQALIDRLEDYHQGNYADLHRGTSGEESISSRLLRGKAGAEFLKVAVRERELDQLAALWVSGLDLEWQSLYEGATPQRIPLPGYAFERKRYWYDELVARRPEALALDAPRQTGLARLDEGPVLPATTTARGPVPPPQVTEEPGRRISLKPKAQVEPPALTQPKPEPRLEAPAAEPQKVTPVQFRPTSPAQPNLFRPTAPSLPAAAPRLNPPAAPRLQPSVVQPLTAPQPSSGSQAQDDDRKLQQHVAGILTRMLAATLFLEEHEIDPRKPLGELGLDSVLGVELMRQINLELGIEVPATVLYDYPEIGKLAPYLVAQLLAARNGRGPAIEEGSL